MSGITTEEWLSALDEAMRPTEAAEGWKTAGELAAMMNVNVRTINKRLTELHSQGRLLVRHVIRPRIDGQFSSRPVYAIKLGDVR